MKYSTKVSDAIHMLVYIQLTDVDLSSKAIATSIKTNPGCIRQHMMKLRKAGIINSVHGHAMPSLAREPKNITLLDIYHAMEGDTPLIHLDTNINPECGVGSNVQFALKEYYDEVQKVAEAKMKSITLEDIITSFHQKVGSSSPIPPNLF